MSKNNDFSTGYHLHPVALFTAEDGDGILSTGEQETFTVSYDIRGVVDLELTHFGTHYAQLWLNPDRSANFMNGEDMIVPSHFIAESRYDDNRFAIVSFEVPTPPIAMPEQCLPDGLEENDTLATASTSVKDTEYIINTCEDGLDVFSFSLNAGQVIEIIVSGEGRSYWNRSIVAPDGSYLVKDRLRDDTIFQASATGIYHLIMNHLWYSINGKGSREATFVLETLR